jgi:hypothetical protein
MDINDPRYRIREFQARVMDKQLSDGPDMFDLDREIEAFALDTQTTDPEFDTTQFLAAVYAGDGNMVRGRDLPAYDPGPGEGAAAWYNQDRG